MHTKNFPACGSIPSPACRPPSPEGEGFVTESFSERDTTPRAETVYVLFHSLPFVSEQECERVASGTDAALASRIAPEIIILKLFIVYSSKARRQARL